MPNWRNEANGISLILQLSSVLLTAVLGPLLLGLWFDRTFGTAPFTTLCLSVAGVLLGTVAIYRVVNKTYKQIGGPKG